MRKNSEKIAVIILIPMILFTLLITLKTMWYNKTNELYIN